MQRESKRAERVTIKDVAKRAELSPSTVSRALNKSGYVSSEAQHRIDAAVAELGYRPNWMARGLKGKPSRLVGLIIPDIFNVYYTSIAQSVSDALRTHDYELILCVNNEDRELDLNHLKTLWKSESTASFTRILPAVITRCLCGICSPGERRLLS